MSEWCIFQPDLHQVGSEKDIVEVLSRWLQIGSKPPK